MKKAFAVATVSVWTLGLLIGVGFAVAGEIIATNDLPAENLQLAKVRDALLDSVKSEHGRGDQYLMVVELQNKMLFESVALPDVTYSGPWPKEE